MPRRKVSALEHALLTVRDSKARKFWTKVVEEMQAKPTPPKRRGRPVISDWSSVIAKYGGNIDLVPQRAWKSMEANRAKRLAREHAAREAARGDRSAERSILDEWERNEHGLSAKAIERQRRYRKRHPYAPTVGPEMAVFREQAQKRGMPEETLRAAFSAYHRHAGRESFEPLNAFALEPLWERYHAVFDNSNAERGHGVYLGAEDCESSESKAERTIEYVLTWYSQWKERGGAAAPAEPSPLPVKPPRKRRTKAEMARDAAAERQRKRRAQQPRKPRDYITAAEASLVTRRAKLAALQATPPGETTVAQLERLKAARRCEEGIRRVEETLAGHRRAAATKGGNYRLVRIGPSRA